jgi:hypothetical protein
MLGGHLDFTTRIQFFLLLSSFQRLLIANMEKDNERLSQREKKRIKRGNRVRQETFAGT